MRNAAHVALHIVRHPEETDNLIRRMHAEIVQRSQMIIPAVRSEVIEMTFQTDHIPDLAARYHILQREEIGVKSAVLIRHADKTLFFGQGKYLPRLLCRRRERFLDQAVFPCVQDLLRIRNMESVGRVDYDQIHLRVVQNFLKTCCENDILIIRFVFCELRNIFLPPHHIFNTYILHLLRIGDVIFPDAHAKSDICHCDHDSFLLY